MSTDKQQQTSPFNSQLSDALKAALENKAQGTNQKTQTPNKQTK